VEIKTIKISTLDGLELKEAVFKEQSFPNHFHDAYSIGIIEEGIENISLAGAHITAHAHSAIIINPYEIHANSFYDKDKWKYRIVYINEELMQYLQRNTCFENKKIFFPTHILDDKQLYQYLLAFHRSAGDTNILVRAIQYLIGHYAIVKPDDRVQATPAAIIEAAYKLRIHYSDKILLDDIAAAYGMDKYKFIRAFRRHTGLTPVSYLLLHRINEAKRLIAANEPITSVALETGFYDQSHFTHYFQKYIGVSPLAYRKGIFTV
jgi:AraC-like DNA-binding protein